jgi:hypothetical protein
LTLSALLLAETDAMLRAEGPFAVQARGVPVLRLAGIILAGGFVYGCVMGLHAGRPVQALYSGLKVPILLGVTTCICLPSFYVANMLLGLGGDFSAACRGVLASQATIAAALGSLSPIIGVVYLSIDAYNLATVSNGILFACATGAGQAMLTRHYRPLIRRSPRHRITRALWLVLYVFVAIQMAWVLRPFIGSRDLPPQFFREEAWSNAYVQLVHIVARAFRLE